MYAMQLVIYGIHTTTLRLRQPALHQLIQSIRVSAQAAGYEVTPKLVLSPSSADIQDTLKSFEGRIDYSKTGEADFDGLIHTLNLQELSNLEKHRKAWSLAVAHPDASAWHLVLEDDATPHGAFPISALQTHEHDMVPLCAPSQRLIWLSKEAYAIRASAARDLLASTEKIKYNARGHLCHWVARHQARVFLPAHRAFVDGSKLGLFPSSIHTFNPLIFNKDYVELMREVDRTPTPEALKAFEAPLSKLPSPDFMYALGKAYEKAGAYERARDLLIGAVQEMARQNGILTTTSEVLKSAMDVYKHLQPEVLECAKTPSRFDLMSPAPMAFAPQQVVAASLAL
jgi:hypothetical protein